VERGTHAELLARKGRYFDLYTKQAGLEENRYVNPGEKEAESGEEAATGEAKEPREGIASVARDLLGLRRG
jgi:hypothetical protein